MLICFFKQHPNICLQESGKHQLKVFEIILVVISEACLSLSHSELFFKINQKDYQSAEYLLATLTI